MSWDFTVGRPPATSPPVGGDPTGERSAAFTAAGGEVHSVTDHLRLWTPWRMPYVGGGLSESGCIFCNRLAADDDVRSLILHRGPHAFVIMNLYPYNTGHLMLVPNQHVASPEAADPAALAEFGTLLPPLLRGLRRVFRCDGFNLGMNVGAVAGAGVADHLHQHIVPRWQGDANFMPILAGTMVLPELIPVTYAKVRAELGRELHGASAATCVVLAGDDRLLVGEAGRLPVATATADEPIWRAAVRTVTELAGVAVVPAGWAGPARSSSPGDSVPALTLRPLSDDPPPPPPVSAVRWVATTEFLADHDRATLSSALASLRAFDNPG